MMRILAIALVLAAHALAQTAPAPSTPAAGAQSTTPKSHAQHHGMMRQQHQQHMQQVLDDVASMRSQLEQLKSDAAAISDPQGRKLADDNAKLWETLIAALERHLQQMQMMGHGGMMGAGPSGGHDIHMKGRSSMGKMGSSTGPTNPNPPDQSGAQPNLTPPPK